MYVYFIIIVIITVNWKEFIIGVRVRDMISEKYMFELIRKVFGSLHLYWLE